METKSIAVLLAVYNPPKLWLEQLLDSLNGQTYPAVRLYVRDDCSTSVSFAEIQETVRKHITAFPVVFLRNESNLGSTATFAALVSDCTEDYIAFCDQDDIWLPDKLTNTVRLLEESPLHPVLVCSDVRIIDGNGKKLEDSIGKRRRRHVFLRGEGLAPGLIYRNFVMGCTVVLRRETAVSFLPYPDAAVHDHYLAFRAALEGAIDRLDEPQMLYRVYGGNQTETLAGVCTKEDYRDRRILTFRRRIDAFCAVASLPELERAKQWADARLRNFNREKGGFRDLFRLRAADRTTTLFELFALRMPTFLFRFCVGLIRRGVL